MRKTLPYVSFFLLFLTASLLFSAVSGVFAAPRAVATDAAPALPVIVLDAGHGGMDGGTSGGSGVAEKDLNLAVTKKLAALFRAAGYTVVETRTDDRLLSGDAPKGKRKQADLENRLAVSKAHPGSIFISIHMNAYPLPDCEGLQVWYSQNNEDSALYATAVQEGVRALLQQGNNRKIKAATSSIYLLRYAENPAILIECGFLSTPAEEALLCSEAYQKRLALAIFSSLDKKIG